MMVLTRTWNIRHGLNCCSMKVVQTNHTVVSSDMRRIVTFPKAVPRVWSTGSTPRLWAGGPSIRMLIHRICIAFSGFGKLSSVESAMRVRAATLVLSWNLGDGQWAVQWFNA